MQGNIDQALTLVAAGNAYLRDGRLDGFWPNARTFAFTKSCEFRIASESGEGEFPLRASDPLAWFTSLKPWASGLRLHHMERPLQPNQMPGIAPRMLVAFVGGGPRWIIEAVGAQTSEMWEGFDRLGDRKDPNRKIWSTTYVLLGETRPDAMAATAFEPAVARLRAALERIEAFSRAQSYDPFTACFERARAALDGSGEPTAAGDLARYAGLSDQQLRTYAAIEHAWVFGGMGSWNDIGGTGPEYDEVSEALFAALNDAVCGVANSTF